MGGGGKKVAQSMAGPWEQWEEPDGRIRGAAYSVDSLYDDAYTGCSQLDSV